MTAFTDNFTGTSGDTLESRAGWTRVDGAAGTGQINGSNQLKTVITGGDTAYRTPDTGSADHYAQADFVYSSSSAAFDYPVCVRITNNANYIGFRLRDTVTTKRQLSKMVASSQTILASDNTDPGNGTYKLKGSGNTITVDYNSVNVFSVTESFNNTVTFNGMCLRITGVDPLIDNWQSDANAAAASDIIPLYQAIGLGGPQSYGLRI